MSLHKKIHLVLISVVVCYVLLSYVILSFIVIPAFQDLEADTASRNLRRVERVMREEFEALHAQGVDWAQWDDAYSFVQGNNPAFIKSNFSDSTLSSMNLSFMAFYDETGRLVSAQFARAEEADYLSQEIPRQAAADYPLVKHEFLDSKVDGVVETRIGTMLVVSLPIVTTGVQGPIAGALALGRLMDSGWIENKRQQTEVEFRLLATDDPAVATIPQLLADLAGSSESTVTVAGEGELLSYWLMHDIYGAPALVVEARTPRDTMALGARTVDLTMLFLILAGLLVMGTMWLILQRAIVSPLFAVKSHILGIRQSGEFSRRMGVKRLDEIGLVAREFDALTAELERARKRLVEQSYKAGMAETAAGVLHNIRNAMMPLVNRIAKASASIQEADELCLGEALGEMLRHNGLKEREAKLKQYVDLALGELERLHESALDDLRVASEQAAQVEGILNEQERLTHSEPVIETLDLGDVVQEAANVVPACKINGTTVELDESIFGHRVRAHRLGLVQVLGNVLVNAREAIERAGRHDGRISLAAERTQQEGGGSIIRLRVSDNGVGIESERLTAIFQRGHTSKPEGKGGLGLHWCANTLVGMGGWLSAHSTGSNEGAEFQVYLPEALKK